MINIVTSYFYQIRNFTPNIIPVSTCLSDPIWYRPPEDREYYIDKRGIINGLRYTPIIVQGGGACPCIERDPSHCPAAAPYREALAAVDFDKMTRAFEYCLNKFNADTIALMVYEAPTNPCSERGALQELFRQHGYECKEWNND